MDWNMEWTHGMENEMEQWTYTGAATLMSLIIRTIQSYEHPPFPEKKWLIIVFQAFEHPHLKLLFQYMNSYTFWSLKGGQQTSTSLTVSAELQQGLQNIF